MVAPEDSTQRLAELLAGEALGDLDRAERAELDALLRAEPGHRRDEFRPIAALTRAALRGPAPAPMPQKLRSALQRTAEDWTARAVQRAR
ncbi:MAG: hypothetical protein L6Q83_02360 [Gammaproteobacteria bacterium]|nr:hypothetical protein [Gammaproteobacteria bacterium]